MNKKILGAVIAAALFVSAIGGGTIVNANEINREPSKNSVEIHVSGEKIYDGFIYQIVEATEPVPELYTDRENTSRMTASYSNANSTITDYSNGTHKYESYVKIVGCNKNDEQIAIPETIEELPVREIDSNAFQNRKNITSVEFPNSLRVIGSYAFTGCSSITSLTFPKDFKTIGAFAFYGCTGLKEISFPRGLSYINTGAFSLCTSLENVILPDRVCVTNSVFSDCTSLKSVTLPYMSDIESETFKGCTSLSEVIFPTELLPDIDSDTEETDDTDFVDWDEYEDTDTNYWYDNQDTETNSSRDTEREVRSLSTDKAASTYSYSYNCRIGAFAFEGCTSLKSFTFPKHISSVNASAFANCKSLESVYLSENERFWCSYNVFNGCDALKTIYVPDGLVYVDKTVFNSCEALETISVGEGNDYYSSIDGVLFDKEQTILVRFPLNNRYTDYTVPETVSTIDDSAFSHAAELKSIHISDNVFRISGSAFESCRALENVDIPNSVIMIGNRAFSECISLRSISLPSSLTSVCKNTFSYCYNLEKISVPDNIVAFDTTIASSSYKGGLTSDINRSTSSTTSRSFPYEATNKSNSFYYCNNLTIFGRSGSTAEAYAAENNIPFKSLSKFESTPVTYNTQYDNYLKSLNDTDTDTDTKEQESTDIKKEDTKPTKNKIGDLDNDGKITSSDSLFVLRASVGLEKINETQKKQADVNGNGSVESSDSLAILRYSVGLIDEGILIDLK